MSSTPDYEYFEVLPEHVALLRRAYVGWDPCETGAPAIDPKRPYGNSDVAQDMAEILGLLDAQGEVPTDVLPRLRQLHAGTRTALQVFLCLGRMEPGLYRTPRYMQRWEPVTSLPTSKARLEGRPD